MTTLSIVPTAQLTADLAALIDHLGESTHYTSPSVYDTSMVLRLLPGDFSLDATCDWLLRQQHSDGGWGSPHVPLARHVCTLSAMLALFVRARQFPRAHAAIDGAFGWLEDNTLPFEGFDPRRLMASMELVIPMLLADSRRVGMPIDPTPYGPLEALAARRSQAMADNPPNPGEAPFYCWEAWGREAWDAPLDGVNSVGHSPSATAKWVYLARQEEQPTYLLNKALAYLKDASRATPFDIPGVLPVVFPFDHFESTYSLALLQRLGLHLHPVLAAHFAGQQEKLAASLTDDGLGFTRHFCADCDNTALAALALGDACPIDAVQCLDQFRKDQHYYMYRTELNYSLLGNMHALTLLHRAGKPTEALERLLIDHVQDGLWPADKWNASPLFVTLEAVFALAPMGYEALLAKTAEALMDQRDRWGWGSVGCNDLESAYVVLALDLIERYGSLPREIKCHRDDVRATLSGRYLAGESVLPALWCAKELHSLYRIDQCYLLSALILGESPG